MRLLVCGSRDCDSAPEIYSWLNAVDHQVGQIEVIIHGDAYGADKISGKWAEYEGRQVEVYPADWNKHGRGAGHIRNQQMLDEGFPDRVLAFFRAGQETPGTKNMIERARKAGVPVTIVEF